MAPHKRSREGSKNYILKPNCLMTNLLYHFIYKHASKMKHLFDKIYPYFLFPLAKEAATPITHNTAKIKNVIENPLSKSSK